MSNTQPKKILLHTCCGPCLTHVYSVCSSFYDVHVFFYNPNISPRSEYQKRLAEVEYFCTVNSIPVTIAQYNPKEWFNAIKAYRFYGERSERCYACYAFRLEETFRYAREHNYEAVCTTLTVSPYKDAQKINEIGKELSIKYQVEYIESDFKADGGYKHSIELSKQYGMYRQKYCGCIYSKLERKKTSLWSIKMQARQDSKPVAQ